MIYKYIGRHQMNRRSYLCLYVYDNSKEFKIGIAGFSIYGTKSEKLRFYLGSSSRNFFSPPKLKMPPRALLNRDWCCRFKLLCALKIMKNSKQANSFYSLWDTKICKQNLFTLINCWDNAVCLHFCEIQKSQN